jgi:hypothetical protein
MHGRGSLTLLTCTPERQASAPGDYGHAEQFVPELPTRNCLSAIDTFQDIVHDRPIGEVAVKDKITRNAFGNDPINQLLRQVGMVLEGMGVIALLTLAEAPEVERIVLARRVHVGDEQTVVANQMPRLSVVPEPASVLDQLAIVINQGVVKQDDASWRYQVVGSRWSHSSRWAFSRSGSHGDSVRKRLIQD